MAKKQIDLGLTGLDELFMDDQERAESKLPNSDKSFAYGEKGNENTVVLTWKRTSGDYYPIPMVLACSLWLS